MCGGRRVVLGPWKEGIGPALASLGSIRVTTDKIRQQTVRMQNYNMIMTNVIVKRLLQRCRHHFLLYLAPIDCIHKHLACDYVALTL